MMKRFAVEINPKLREYLEKALAKPEIKKMLAYYHLNENEQGVVRLALTLFLADIDVAPDRVRHRRNGNKTA